MGSGGINYVNDLISNVHDELPAPEVNVQIELVKGKYLYYHYGCDGFDDRGWGCGYRTLMSICSWIQNEWGNCKNLSSMKEIPNNRKVQEMLVNMNDKENDFLNSKQWIGSVEVALIIDELYQVPCKLLHVQKGSRLNEHTNTLFHHFKSIGSPCMMGGDCDYSSKGIIGICKGKNDTYLLIIDPHFWGVARDKSVLQSRSWVKWQKLRDFNLDSFYNICLPQWTPCK